MDILPAKERENFWVERGAIQTEGNGRKRLQEEGLQFRFENPSLWSPSFLLLGQNSFLH